MPPLSPWLTAHWFRLALVLLGLVLILVAYILRRRTVLAWTLGGAGTSLALFALGGIVFPTPTRYFGGVAGWSFSLALGAFFVMAALLLLTGFWYRPLAFIVPGFALIGAGGLLLGESEYHLADLGQTLTEMRLRSPWWLLLMGAIPFVILLGYRRLTRHELRPWLAMGLRVLGVGLLAFALAEPFFNQASRALTVLFVVDRSLSVPEDPGDDPARPGERIDLRNKRIIRFINDAVQKRGAGHERDKAGLIVFGRRPRLDLPPSDAPHFNLDKLPDIEDGSYTDIGAALKLALASFPEGTARRIVLVSDGNENLGNAEEQARLAETLGVQIDVLPLAGGKRNEEEILVERVDAPPVIEQGARVPIRVLVRSHNPNVVVGRLTLRQITDKEGVVSLKLDMAGKLGVEVEPLPNGVRIARVTPRSPADRAGLEVGEEITSVNGTEVTDAAGFDAQLAKAKGEVRLGVRRNPVRVVAIREPAKLIKGLNSFEFERPLTDEQRSYTYEAEFQPLRVEDDKGKKLQDGVPGDRVQNNRASTHVVARGVGRVLLLENKAGDHRELGEKLIEAGKSRFKVYSAPVDILNNYPDRDKLSVFLSNFDCIILANIPADRIPEEQQEVFRSNTHDQGCGLVMIGGPESFGAGGWQNSPVEKALPVDCDIKQLKVQGKSGLVMVMHACEMAQGNFWQKRIAKLAVERLGPNDEVGIIDFGMAGCKWHVPMMEAGPNRAKIMGMIDSLVPGDMPDFDPALKMAHDALMDKKKDIGTKHIIIISDGDPQQNNKGLLKQIKADKIGIATVGIATHGLFEDQKMTDIATPGAGGKKRYYKVTDPKQLPAIYIKETRLVTQSFVHKALFQPRLVYRSGPTLRMPADDDGRMLPLGGFVRTTPKPSPLVEVPIVTPKLPEAEFPILAYWHYGLGKSVAFTSDAGRHTVDADDAAPLSGFWSRRWLEGDAGREGIFASFWEQVVGWALRPVESGRLVMTTEQRDGKIKVTVEARTQDGKPDTSLKLRGGLTSPGAKAGEGKRQELRFVQKNSGQYEAEVKADEAGSYFVNAQAVRMRKEKGQDGKIREIEEGVDSVRAGVTLPYSPEFIDLESNTALMDNLAGITNGHIYTDEADELALAAKEGKVFRAPETRSKSSLPFHYWLLFLAAGLLLLDVAVRRLAFDPDEASAQAQYVWARLRGFPVPPPAQTTSVLRLRARTDAPTVGGGRRFDPVGRYDQVGLIDATAPARPKQPRPTSKPGELAPQADTPAAVPQENLDALLEARKRVWDERKKDKPG